MANETWKFVQAKSKQAMKQVLGIKNDAARMKVTPPLAVAPLGIPCLSAHLPGGLHCQPKPVPARRPGVTDLYAIGPLMHWSLN